MSIHFFVFCFYFFLYDFPINIKKREKIKMKKRIILIITIGIIIFLSLILYINYTKINKENQKIYNEMMENVQKGVEWNVKAMYPGCLIDRNLSSEHLQGNTYYDSSFLIRNGYIKKKIYLM